MTDQPLLIKICDAAKMLGVSSTTIRNLIDAKRLIGVGFGSGSRVNFITRASINALIGGINDAN